jgi:peptidoglycan/LPS O-acetylase OafA/YrhL
MMLFGVWLHAGLSYNGSRPDPYWAIADAPVPALTEPVRCASALFRMQTFFVLAGFFGALLKVRLGICGFLHDRLLRIGAPFLLGWLILFPALRMIFVAATSPCGTAAIGSAVMSGRLWADPYPIHLWFLEYLLIAYLLTLLGLWLWERLGTVWRSFAARIFDRVVRGGLTPLVMVLIALPAYFVTTQPGTDIPLSFVPRPTSLYAYGLFFGFGWVLSHRIHLLPELARQGPAWLGIGMILALVVPGAVPVGAEDPAIATSRPAVPFPWEPKDPEAPPLGRTAAADWSFPLAALGNDLVSWMVVLGLIGLALRMPDRSHPWLRYLSHASYWIYLAHFPVVAGLSLVLMPVPLNGAVKLTLTLAGSLAMLLAAYELGVRRTWLGRLLGAQAGPQPHRIKQARD